MLKSHLLPFFGDMVIENLKRSDVDTYAQQEPARGKAVKTVNDQLAVLSTMIKHTMGDKPKLRFKLDGRGRRADRGRIGGMSRSC